MKTIKIKSIDLINFKGIRKLSIGFDKETNVYGANGTGKTSLFDAFTWLLFGKDSSDRTSFEIKTLDHNNDIIPQIDHEVTAVIEIDGEDTEIRRVLREKWVKKRGALEPEFSGNETLFFWNDVPMSAGEFSNKVSSIVDEKVFKLLTSPSAFNSLKWQDQRQVLIDISGGVTDQEVARGDSDFEALLLKLTNKSLEEYQKQIAASVRKSKDELKMLPTRIDEVQRNKPEGYDFDDLKRQAMVLMTKKESLDKQISDKLEAQQEILNKRQEIQKQIHSLKSEISEIEFKAKQSAKEEVRKESSKKAELEAELNTLNSELDKSIRGLEALKRQRGYEENEIENLTKKVESIRAEWHKRNAEEFVMDDSQCKCPTCNREFEAQDIDAKKAEMENKFKENKKRDLEQLTSRGKANSDALETAKKELAELDSRIAKGEDVISKSQERKDQLIQSIAAEETNTEVKSETELFYLVLNADDQYKSNKQKISNLESSLQEEVTVDTSALKVERDEVQKEIDSLKSQIGVEDQIKQADKRIGDLQAEESKLAQTIADYEKEQYVIENFIKAKIDTLESLINERFSFVKFKLFELQINGGEVPTCKALINGVPFSDANTASKINAGIDIINTLCDFYNVSAPIFIDNRESVVDLIDSQSQIINLIVSGADKKLRVEQPSQQFQTA